MSIRTWWKLGAVVAFVPIVVLTPSSPVAAATIDVTTTVDENNGTGPVSLREAVILANSGPEAPVDVIAVPAGTHELTICGAGENAAATGDLDIIWPVTIRGPVSGTATITIDPSCEDRIFNVLAGGTTTFERLTLTGGRPNDTNGGAAIRGASTSTTMVLDDMVIQGNTVIGSGAGGGIVTAGSLTITDSTISGNQAGTITNNPGPDGGGIAANFGGMLTIRRSTISGNTSGSSTVSGAGRGGGVYVDARRTLLIEDSVISDNSLGTGVGGALGWFSGGGGVAFDGNTTTEDSPGSVTIIDTTVSGNVGGVGRGGGGGLHLDSTDVTLTNVDVIGNQNPPDARGQAAGPGGGIHIAPEGAGSVRKVVDITITGGTISDNTIGVPAGGVGLASAFGGDGGGLHVVAAGGALTIDGTSISGNRAGDAKGTFSAGSGGGVYADGSSTASVDPLAVTLDGVTISDNRAGDGDTGLAGNGGGVFATTSTFNLGGTIVVRDSSFEGNAAGAAGGTSQGGFGGGLDARSDTVNTPGSITIENTVFDSNVAGPGGDDADAGAGGSGGGANLIVDGTGGSSDLVAISGSTFTANLAGAGGIGIGGAGTGGAGGLGGGVVVTAETAGIDTSTFSGNDAGDGGDGPAGGGRGGRGGAAWIVTNHADVSSSAFDGNTSGDGGSSTDGFGGAAGGGGALMFDNFGPVTVSSSSFEANRSGDGGVGPVAGSSGGQGGAVYVDNGGPGPIEVTGSSFEGNVSGDGGDSVDGDAGRGGSGGALAVFASGQPNTVSLDTVTVIGNRSGSGGTGDTAVSAFGGFGGGVWADLGEATSALGIVDSVIADNVTGDGGSATGGGNTAWPGGWGGGVYADIGNSAAGNGDNATVTVTSSSITGNETGAGGSGGSNGRGGHGAGMWLSGGVGSGGLVSIANTTIADNVAGIGGAGDGSGRGDGGGVYLDDVATTELIFSTITGNNAQNGNNVFTIADNNKFTATVIGEPTGGTGPTNCRIVAPAVVTSLGHNVETQGDTCELQADTDLVDLDEIVLGPLQDNGGIGLSRIPLITGSDPLPVLDRVPAPCGNTIDQLGTTRPIGDGCDVGAVEAVIEAPVAADDVIRVGSGNTTLDVLANDDLVGFTAADVVLTIVDKRSADEIEVDDGSLTFRSPTSTGVFTQFTYRACLGVTDQFCDTAEVTLVPEGLSRFVSLSPLRLFDTRPGEPANGPKGYVAGGTEIDVQITGVAGVPNSGVSAVAMNVTATDVEGPGFVTAYATGTQRPLSSNLNFATPGDTIANFVVVPVGADGKVTLYSLSGTHLLADVAGYFTENGISENASDPGAKPGRLMPISPDRVFDTRPSEPAPGPKGFVGAGRTIDVQIAGQAGVPASGVSAVVMNLTATESEGPGFVTAFPAGSSRPLASNINVTGPGQTAPNLVIVPLGVGGKISLYSFSGVHLLGDVTGYFTDGSAPRSLSGLFTPSSPSRVFDTRPDVPPPGSKGFVDTETTRSVRFTANVATPATDVGAVMMNATATEAAAPGFVTVWPKGQTRPLASTLNLTFAGQTRPNAAVIPIGDQGEISFFSFGGTHLLADAFGWFLE